MNIQHMLDELETYGIPDGCPETTEGYTCREPWPHKDPEWHSYKDEHGIIFIWRTGHTQASQWPNMIGPG